MIAEIDSKGRVLVPASIRKNMANRRVRITLVGDVIQLEPLPPAEDLRGKFRHRIKSEWDELEEKGEQFVSQR